MLRAILKFIILLGIALHITTFNNDATAECSKLCRKLKKSKSIGIKQESEYLQKSRDLIVVKNKKAAMSMGYTAYVPCSGDDNQAPVTAANCSPAIVSTRDSVYFCPNQLRPFKNSVKAERKGFSAYTGCGILSPLPSPTPIPSSSPIPTTMTFYIEDGERLTDISSATVLKLNSGEYRAYLSVSDSSLDSETLYFSNSRDGLTFGVMTPIRGVAPSRLTETFQSPTIVQLEDDSFSLIYEQVRHVSSAAVDLYNLVRAISLDGVNFTSPLATPIIENGSSISSRFDASVLKTISGTQRMYYGFLSGLYAVESTNNGESWGATSPVSILGISSGYAPYPNAASVVQKEDGSYYMVFSSQLSDDNYHSALFSAESSDGHTFYVHDQPVLLPRGESTLVNPEILKLENGKIRIYYVERTGSFDSLHRSLKSLLSNN